MTRRSDPFTRNAIKNRALQRDECNPREDLDGALPQFERISDIYARRVNTGAVRRGRRCPPLS